VSFHSALENSHFPLDLPLFHFTAVIPTKFQEKTFSYALLSDKFLVQ